MASPNYTQMQHGANHPSTNPDVQGYAMRLSSACIFRSVSVRLGLAALRFYRTPCVSEENTFLSLSAIAVPWYDMRYMKDLIYVNSQ